VQAAEYAALSRAEKQNYLNSVKMKRDYQNTIDFAREQGFEAGMQKGHEAGVAEGMQNERVQMAKKMLADGVSLEQIGRWSGLTEEELRKL